jgi:hypothetical protein
MMEDHLQYSPVLYNLKVNGKINIAAISAFLVTMASRCWSRAIYLLSSLFALSKL